MEYAKDACGPSRPTKGMVDCERAGRHGEGGSGRPVGLGGPKGRMGQLADGPVGPEVEKILRIKIGFLNLSRLLKYTQGDLGGILTQGFFPNSSKLLKDF
jgi:hypothetical protein